MYLCFIPIFLRCIVLQQKIVEINSGEMQKQCMSDVDECARKCATKIAAEVCVCLLVCVCVGEAAILKLSSANNRKSCKYLNTATVVSAADSQEARRKWEMRRVTITQKPK